MYPQSILNAAPTDGLFGDSRTDEDQIGASYDELEWAMKMQNKVRVHPIFRDRKKKFLTYSTSKQANQHKMKPIPVCEIPNLQELAVFNEFSEVERIILILSSFFLVLICSINITKTSHLLHPFQFIKYFDTKRIYEKNRYCRSSSRYQKRDRLYAEKKQEISRIVGKASNGEEFIKALR